MKLSGMPMDNKYIDIDSAAPRGKCSTGYSRSPWNVLSYRAGRELDKPPLSHQRENGVHGTALLSACGFYLIKIASVSVYLGYLRLGNDIFNHLLIGSRSRLS